MKWSKSFTALLLLASTADATCPFAIRGGAGRNGTMMQANPHTEEGRRLLAQLQNKKAQRRRLAQNPRTGDVGIPDGGFDAVRESLREMLVTSQDFFPADFEPPIGPNYGGLMIRLAWHCSGSYRKSDGRGGCDGGRIRFEPELTWMDNASLGFAIKLLEPIKEQFGEKLSWGDLIILAGSTAIESMGGPVLGFCGGRVDDPDGNNSLILGPSDLQEELTPCQTIGMQGQCESPLGPTTVGLIYVNPEGPVTAPGDPVASGLDVRKAFERMGFNDTETVALIGGGHSFGKCHGACPDPPCGEEPMVGIGPNTYSSGFEGAWTTSPTTWTNQYFHNLLNLTWRIERGPGRLLQWAPTDSDADIIMLTSDIALSADPDYLPIAEEFAANISSLEEQFAYAWYRLTTADMGPHERCINDDPENIPPPMAWQNPLPVAEPDMEVDYIPIRSMIHDVINEDSSTIEAFSNLAKRCAATYRDTDYRGGCNGARIRFSPENEWPENAGTSEALALLEPVKEAFPAISYADLIVLAGQAAVEAAGAKKMPFCGGRVDALDGVGSEDLAPRYYSPMVVSVRDDMQVKGLSPREGVALFAHPSKDAPLNQFFIDLLDGSANATAEEEALLEDEFLPIVTEFAESLEVLLEEFAQAWIHMMTSDRYDGPTGNICTEREDATLMATADVGIPEGGFAAVREDIKKMLVTSQDFFPADFEPPIGPNYGGLMIRLAWHCNGSYRASDGRGGCDGGRVRFDPELNWMDNASLANALKVLEPIKEKYGSSLSWGDLIVLAGTTAIESMGGPVLGFCGGRIDEEDGSNSLILGPSDIQEELSPCQTIGMQGQCESPLGPTTVGLIYVNPEGPVTAKGDPEASGLDVRVAFERMGFNDTETVAIIGGGHAFGKCHGACQNPPCGEEPLVGIGPNTYTSGFEGAWTTSPTTWTNQYFQNLLNLNWEIGTGPGGFLQWAPTDSDADIIMLTTDIALKVDPDYLPISEQFASDIDSLNTQFSHGWYRLMTNDMGPANRCINENPDDIPPPQWWQYPLPAVEADAVDYVSVRAKIQELIDEDVNNIAVFSNLAYRCASTYRATDYRGGCNGARIRFAPENEWPENAGTSGALALLEPVKEAFPAISYADLIVLAGQTALEAAGDVQLAFCGGRVDALDGAGSEGLAPRVYTPPVVSVRDDMQVKGLTPMDGVALYALPSADSSVSTVVSPNALSNQFFVHLLTQDGDFDKYELALLEEEFRPIVELFAEDEQKFLDTFTTAWTKMMTADRFDGPLGNVCYGRNDLTLSDEVDDAATVGKKDGAVPNGDEMAVKEDGALGAGEPESGAFSSFRGVMVRLLPPVAAAVAWGLW